MRAFVLAVSALAASGAIAMSLATAPAQAATSHDKVEYLSTEQTRKLNRPFSEAVRVGNILYLAGVTGVAPGGSQPVPGGIEAETKQVLENISAVLQRNGSSMDQVVKCTVMLADIGEWARMNTVYVTFFPKHFPARSAMGVSGLAGGARVEIECLATVGAAG